MPETASDIDILDELVDERVNFLLNTGDVRTREHLVEFVRRDYEQRIATAKAHMGW